MPAKKQDDSPVYQLKVTLRMSKPPIWRRIQVRGSTTLPKLHQILQIVMGWTDSHLHQFVDGEEHYGQKDVDWDNLMQDERRVRLDRLMGEPSERLLYEYDFGDSWEHELLLEKVLPAEPGVHYPRCVTGKRACPPDDVGGVWGYYAFLEAISDPKHPEHDDMLDWIGGEFDPDAFDLETVNALLAQL